VYFLGLFNYTFINTLVNERYCLNINLLHLPVSSTVLLNNYFSHPRHPVSGWVSERPTGPISPLSYRGQSGAARLRVLAFLQSISPEPVFGCNPVSIAVLVKARYLTDVKW
jgi:hypothetical protein